MCNGGELFYHDKVTGTAWKYKPITCYVIVCRICKKSLTISDRHDETHFQDKDSAIDEASCSDWVNGICPDCYGDWEFGELKCVTLICKACGNEFDDYEDDHHSCVGDVIDSAFSQGWMKGYCSSECWSGRE